ncbi:hypothetical protein MCCG_0721 [Mycoplasma capricolum subsp. capripneumoniae 87001]|uniref:Uncharacterized protein n=1 Tax=Mycoplasma capricolum subsp. capripneumoniae 87001 TaxID=1124992 RepID=A0A9N7BPZ8_MYCCC|nr:hypothetical protein MCCG_0721 [Mycoplasma capricolum subsp. capripneumoniae 87001]
MLSKEFKKVKNNKRLKIHSVYQKNHYWKHIIQEQKIKKIIFVKFKKQSCYNI